MIYSAIFLVAYKGMDSDNDNRKCESESVLTLKGTAQQPCKLAEDGSWITNRSTEIASDGMAGRGLFGVSVPVPIQADLRCADLHINHLIRDEPAIVDIKVKAKSDRMSKKIAIKEAYDLKMKALEEAMRQQLDSVDNDDDDDDDNQVVAGEVVLLSSPEVQESLMVQEGEWTANEKTYRREETVRELMRETARERETETVTVREMKREMKMKREMEMET